MEASPAGEAEGGGRREGSLQKRGNPCPQGRRSGREPAHGGCVTGGASQAAEVVLERLS